jgi:hypothetical protein
VTLRFIDLGQPIQNAHRESFYALAEYAQQAGTATAVLLADDGLP